MKFFVRLCALFFLLSACAKNNSTSYDNFEKFAANVSVTPSEKCKSRFCLMMKEEFRYVTYVGERVYCYWDEKQNEYRIDFKQKAAEFENLITDEISETDYYMLLVKWAALFRDGHVNAMMRSDYEGLELYNFNIRFEILAPGTDHEKLIVAKAGSVLRVGTEITRIQGRDWREYLEDAEKFSSGSTLQMRRRQAGNSILRVLLEKEGPRAVKIEGRYNNADVKETIARNIVLSDGKLEPEEPEGTGLELIQTSILENNIGYLRIDGFGGTKMRELLGQAMDRLSKTSGLILDVRKNGGGDLSGDAILSRLISAPIDRFHQRVNFSDMLKAFRPSILLDYQYSEGKFSNIKPRIVKPAEEFAQYKKPVVVLSSTFCFSACDTFVSSIKENKLGIIIGENTGGGSGNPVVIELPFSGHSFRYSTAQGFTAVGKKLIEGVGTQPDLVLEPTLEERQVGQDHQLLKTVEILSKMLTNNQSQKVILPENLLTTKSKPVTQALEVELDREIRRTGEK